MDFALIRLTAPVQHRAPDRQPTNPDIVADILWAAAIPGDRLEHVRARQGLVAGVVDVAVFHRPTTTPGEQEALHLCQRAIATAPVLAGWTAHILANPTDLLTEPWRPLCI